MWEWERSLPILRSRRGRRLISQFATLPRRLTKVDRCRVVSVCALLFVLLLLWLAGVQRELDGRAASSDGRDGERPAHLLELLTRGASVHGEDRLAEALRGTLREGFRGEEAAPGADEATRAGAEIVDALRPSGSAAVQCPTDEGLPVERVARTRLYLAANLHDSAAVLPHFIHQLAALAALAPPGGVVVSIYESGSTDATADWLRSMQALLDAMQVPSHIVIGGDLQKQKGGDRIDFLARIRNKALQAMWDDEAAAQTDRLVFINDVYFCARDIIRLLSHDADVACGLDFERPPLKRLRDELQEQAIVQALGDRLSVPEWASRTLVKWHFAKMKLRKTPWVERHWNRDSALQFYDMWVAHDADGQAFLKEPPYVSNRYAAQRLRAGLPFPVQSCWNGLIVADARPFLAPAPNRLELRNHMPGECAASECSLLCADFMRLGLKRIVVDPGVRQAYTLADALDLYTPLVRNITYVSWQEQLGAPPIDWRYVPERSLQECCPLVPGRHVVDFDHDCFSFDPWAQNFTADFLAARWA